MQEVNTDEKDPIEWVSYNVAESMPESVFGGMGGWFSKGQRWSDYLDAYKPEYHKDLEVLRASILKNNIRVTGGEHQSQYSESVPVFPDGTAATYSMRAWGDLMAAVWSTHDNKDYSYMDFYC